MIVEWALEGCSISLPQRKYISTGGAVFLDFFACTCGIIPRTGDLLTGLIQHQKATCSSGLMFSIDYVSVRYPREHHDFMMGNGVSNTPAQHRHPSFTWLFLYHRTDSCVCVVPAQVHASSPALPPLLPLPRILPAAEDHVCAHCLVENLSLYLSFFLRPR